MRGKIEALILRDFANIFRRLEISDIRVEVREDGWYGAMVDPGNVRIAEVLLRKDAWEEYEFAPKTFAIDVDRLYRFASDFKKGEILEVSFEDTRELECCFYLNGTLTRTFKLLSEEDIRAKPKIPELEYRIELTLLRPQIDVVKGILATKLEGDWGNEIAIGIVEQAPEEYELCLYAADDEGIKNKGCAPLERATNYLVIEECASVYNVDYFKSVFGLLTKEVVATGTVTIQFGFEYPLKISYERKGLEVKQILLAPRVDEEKRLTERDVLEELRTPFKPEEEEVEVEVEIESTATTLYFLPTAKGRLLKPFKRTEYEDTGLIDILLEKHLPEIEGILSHLKLEAIWKETSYGKYSAIVKEEEISREPVDIDAIIKIVENYKLMKYPYLEIREYYKHPETLVEKPKEEPWRRLMNVLKELEKEHGLEVPEDIAIAAATEVGIVNPEDLIGDLKRDGILYSPAKGLIARVEKEEKIPRANEEIQEFFRKEEFKVKHYVGYRTEAAYGEGERDLRSVVKHEIEELENKDIIDWTGVSDYIALVDSLYTSGYTEVVWLCKEKKYLIDYYCDGDPTCPIKKYEITDGLILSDLGDEGQLIAYQPEKVKIEEEKEKKEEPGILSLTELKEKYLAIGWDDFVDDVFKGRREIKPCVEYVDLPHLLVHKITVGPAEETKYGAVWGVKSYDKEGNVLVSQGFKTKRDAFIEFNSYIRSLIRQEQEKEEETKETEPIPTNLIPYGEALRAYEGISQTPERSAEVVINDFYNSIRSIYDELSKYAETETQKRTLDYYIKEFAKEYATRYRAILRQKAGLISPMVAGPSKFPVARMRKLSESVDKRERELLDWIEKQERRIKKAIEEVGVEEEGGEVAHLRNEIAKLNEKLKRMKDINKIVKSKRLSDTEKKSKLAEMGYSQPEIDKFFTPDYTGKLGFPDYTLTSIRNKIKTREERIETLTEKEEKKKRGEEIIYECYGLKIVENPEEDRYQLLFEEKPDKALRDELKKKGFKWSPTNKAWQRMVTHETLYVIKNQIIPQWEEKYKTEIEKEIAFMPPPTHLLDNPKKVAEWVSVQAQKFKDIASPRDLRARAWSEHVKATGLKPAMDAKDFYRIFDEQWEFGFKKSWQESQKEWEEVPKEPWMMTYTEFIDIAGSEYTAGERFGVPTKNRMPINPETGYPIKGATPEERIHRAVLMKALKEGKTIPEEVLKDYPELIKPKKATELIEVIDFNALQKVSIAKVIGKSRTYENKIAIDKAIIMLKWHYGVADKKDMRYGYAIVYSNFPVMSEVKFDKLYSIYKDEVYFDITPEGNAIVTSTKRKYEEGEEFTGKTLQYIRDKARIMRDGVPTSEFIEPEKREPEAKETWMITKDEFMNATYEYIARYIYENTTSPRIRLEAKDWLDKYKGRYDSEEAKKAYADYPGLAMFEWSTTLHKAEIRKALKEGITVPEEVLRDYPDLVKKPPEEEIPEEKWENVTKEKLEEIRRTSKLSEKYAISQAKAAKKVSATEEAVFEKLPDELDLGPWSDVLLYSPVEEIRYLSKAEHTAFVKLVDRGWFRVYRVSKPVSDKYPSGFTYVLKKTREEEKPPEKEILFYKYVKKELDEGAVVYTSYPTPVSEILIAQLPDGRWNVHPDPPLFPEKPFKTRPEALEYAETNMKTIIEEETGKKPPVPKIPEEGITEEWMEEVIKIDNNVTPEIVVISTGYAILLTKYISELKDYIPFYTIERKTIPEVEEFVEVLRYENVEWVLEDIVWSTEAKRNREIWYKEYTEDELRDKKVDEIKEIAKIKNLSTIGKKEELIARIIEKPPDTKKEEEIREYGKWIRENFQTADYKEVRDKLREWIIEYYKLDKDTDYIFKRSEYEQIEIGINDLAGRFFDTAANGWDLLETFEEWEVQETREEFERRKEEEARAEIEKRIKPLEVPIEEEDECRWECDKQFKICIEGREGDKELCYADCEREYEDKDSEDYKRCIKKCDKEYEEGVEWCEKEGAECYEECEKVAKIPEIFRELEVPEDLELIPEVKIKVEKGQMRL